MNKLEAFERILGLQPQAPKRKKRELGQFRERDKVTYLCRGNPFEAEVVRDYAARMVRVHYWYRDENGVICHHWVYTTEDKLERREG